MTSTNPPQPAESTAERGYHNTQAAYTLPNDNTEHLRLEAQSERLRDLMSDKLIHAPLKQNNGIQKAVDIGCGTGVVTHEIASLFPSAQVYGVDLSPVPDIREKLPNITYVEGNINELADSTDPDSCFKAGSFDYIFSRLLVLGMTGWKSYVERCVSLAKPGGWIEMHDVDMSTHIVPQDLTPAQRQSLHPHDLTVEEVQSNSHPASAWLSWPPWQSTLDKLLKAKGLDQTAGAQLPGLFADAGLQDVRVRRYLYPFSLWEGMTDVERRYARHHKETLGDVMPMMVRKLGTENRGVVDEVELERAVRDAESMNDSWEVGRGFCWVYVVCGRKAS